MKLIRRENVMYPKLPMGSYLYKEKNGKKIYKNKYTKEFYIVFPADDGRWFVEQYIGECNC